MPRYLEIQEVNKLQGIMRSLLKETFQDVSRVFDGLVLLLPDLVHVVHDGNVEVV